VRWGKRGGGGDKFVGYGSSGRSEGCIEFQELKRMGGLDRRKMRYQYQKGRNAKISNREMFN